jgi:hypothetical protein
MLRIYGRARPHKTRQLRRTSGCQGYMVTRHKVAGQPRVGPESVHHHCLRGISLRVPTVIEELLFRPAPYLERMSERKNCRLARCWRRPGAISLLATARAYPAAPPRDALGPSPGRPGRRLRGCGGARHPRPNDAPAACRVVRG